MPHFHMVSNNLVALAPEFDVRPVFRNFYKLSRLVHFPGVSTSGCQIKRKEPVGYGVLTVVDRAAAACGFCCMDQTERRITGRITEHRLNVQK